MRFTTRPEIAGRFGVVASTHWLASQAGMAILERGGNAFDAGVATGFALQVVEPHLNGPGGEVPILIAPRGERPQVLCGQGPAPAAATLEAYRARGLGVVPGSGMLAAVVPGAFDAWMTLLLERGTLRLRDVLEHAIAFSEDGYVMLPAIAHTIGAVKKLFSTEWTSSAEVYLPNGAVPEPGSVFRNRDLARAYSRIVEEAEAAHSSREGQIEAARRIWREGFVAEAIDAFCRSREVMDTTGRRNKALLTGHDLAGYRARWEDPIALDYRGVTVLKAGPWSQGPSFLQQLAILRGFDFSGLDENAPEFVHSIAEATKLAMADRDAFYGDPDFVDVPLDRLLSAEYAASRRALIGEQASLELRPGPGGAPLPERAKGATPEGSVDYGLSEPTNARFDDELGGSTGDTCHFDIVDRWGSMISATPSGGWLHSSPVIPPLGFCLTNRAQMFWLDERSPACIAPGKRPRTTLSPNLALRGDEPWLAFGTPGGDQQDQWSLHFFLRVVEFGLNLQEAIDAPAFHTDHLLSSFYPRECDFGHLAIESRFPARTVEALGARGHRLVVDEPWALGRMAAAAREGMLLKAAANPRRMQGYAVGR